MKKIIRLLPLIAVYIAIIYLSTNKPSGTPPLFENIDKLYHFIAYFTLGFTICFSIESKKIRVVSLLGSIIMGLLIEYVQGLLPYRDMSIADGLANTLGLLVGFFIYIRFFIFFGRICEILRNKVVRKYN